MTAITITNQTIESQITQLTVLPEGPIKNIPSDIVGSILYLSNHSENTRLVNHDWNDLTFAVVLYKNQELEQTIPLIIKNLNQNTQTQCRAALTELHAKHQSESDFIFTFSEARHVFLTDKGLLIGILRKLPQDEEDQLQIAIGEKLPDSLKDIFEISKLLLGADKVLMRDKVDLYTFFTLLQSYQPLSMDDRGYAVFRAVCFKNIEFVKLLLANGPISYDERGYVVSIAAGHNNLELARWLLATGPISEYRRGKSVKYAAMNNNLEFVKMLLADGPIPHNERRLAILKATVNMNLELVRELTDKWIIAEVGAGAALLGGITWLSYKMYSGLAESQAILDKSIASLAVSRARLEESVALLAESRARLDETIARLAAMQNRL